MDLVIMAAGMGSRFGGLKQVEPIGPNDEFIIDYSIYDAIKAGFNRIVFIIKEENYDLFYKTVGKRIEKKIKVEYVFQDINKFVDIHLESTRVKPWGTAHAILCCKDVVKDNFVVINADDFYGRSSFIKLKDYMENIKEDSYHFSMAGYVVGNTLSENGNVKRGICKENNGYLDKIIEASIGYENNVLKATKLSDNKEIEVKENDLVSMNFFGFTPKIFSDLEEGFHKFLEENKNNIESCEYLIPEVTQELINKKKCDVKVLKTNEQWYGVTYKEDKAFLVSSINKLIKEGVYPTDLWK